MLWFILIVPGLIAFYFMILRPILKAIPQFKKFYAEADGFWMKLSALGGHSLSIAWGYFMMVMGMLGSLVDMLGSALGDPELKQQITDQLSGINPKAAGVALMIISLVTIVARLRTLVR